MHLNVKAKINLILNDFLKSNGAELMCKVKRHQFCFLQTKASLFFPLYSICYFFSYHYCFQGPVYHFTGFSWNYQTNNAKHLHTKLNTRWDSVNIILFMASELEMP